MNLISTKLHALIGYSIAVILISLPLVFNFNHSFAQRSILPIIGGIKIIYTLLTDYEWGIIKIIDFKIHLALDIIAGLFLSISPWLFDFKGYFHEPHVIIGISLLLLSLIMRVFYTAYNFTPRNTNGMKKMQDTLNNYEPLF